jgi:hypothetical protein
VRANAGRSEHGAKAGSPFIIAAIRGNESTQRAQEATIPTTERDGVAHNPLTIVGDLQHT